MNVQAEVDREQEALQRIATVARRSACPTFADLMWTSLPSDLFDLFRNPGVMFESPRRVVVFQELDRELRYYAGGWCLDQSRIYLEQDRMWAEGSELGVFETVRDALALTEQYLVDEQDLQSIAVRRRVRFAQPGTG
jgi:hypothetical protein